MKMFYQKKEENVYLRVRYFLNQEDPWESTIAKLIQQGGTKEKTKLDRESQDKRSYYYFITDV